MDRAPARTKVGEPSTSQPAEIVARAELTLGVVTRVTAQEPSHLTLASRPHMEYNGISYVAEISARQIATLRRAFHGALAMIGSANGAGQRHALQEAGVQAQRALLSARWIIQWGPLKAEDGLAGLTAARTTHGKYTKVKLAEAKGRAKVGR